MMLNACDTWRDTVECELRIPPVVLSCFVFTISYFVLFYLFSALNVNIAVWAHRIESV